jgi:subtilase family serine protease
MRKAEVRGCLAWMSAVLMVSALVSCTHAARPAAASPSSPGLSKSQRIQVLTRALMLTRREFGKLRNEGPGPADVLDYQPGDLWRRGIDGTGTTVAVIEAWNPSPILAKLIASRDNQFGLPNPQIRTIYPTGRRRLPATCPPGMAKLGPYGSCRGWGVEAALDVLCVHMMAPYAKILIAVAPPDSEITDDAASQVAPPEFMQAVEYLSVHRLANVISISDGSAESTYSHGFEEIRAQDPGELTAAADGIPVLVATGDTDAAQHLAVSPIGRPVTSFITAGRATAAWDDSPWVTAVGGSVPHLSATGQRLGPDPVWNPSPIPPPAGDPEGEGAGFSAVYARPSYQDSVAAITRSKWRSVPDITMDASGGTSEAAPLLAGVLALATQLNHGKNVGPVNNALYHVLGPAGLKDGIADVVSGNNTLTIGGKVVVRGFTAAKGFDVASGWGTVRASAFASALASATQAAHQDAAVRAEAAASLTRLEHREQFSTSDVARGGTTLLTGEGFLPGHPVRLDIDGHEIVTLHADERGSVTYLINPSALGLPPGRHVADLVSMLITTSNVFHSW